MPQVPQDSYPGSVPAGQNKQSSFRINNTYDGSGSVFTTNDRCVFEFTSIGDTEVTITVSLEDNQGNGALGSWRLHWLNEPDTVKLIEFDGFGLRADQVTAVDEVNYSINLFNHYDRSQGVEAYATVYG